MRILLPLVALALPLAAQPQLMPAGTTLRLWTNWFTRGSAGFGAGELIQRFDADELRGFGTEAATGLQVVRGVAVLLKSLGTSVPDPSVDIYLYTEDPARPGYPELNAPLANVDNVMPAPGGLFPVPTAATFAQPVVVPTGRDLFVGVRLNPGAATNNGTYVGVLSGISGSAPFEFAGGGMPTSPPEANSYRLFRDLVTNTLTYESRGTYHLDLLTSIPSGAPTTIYLANALPGTTTMIAGLHPDATNPSVNPGRADHVGFMFSDPAGTDGTPVAFVASFADFAPITPLDALVPGSLGGLCLDATTMFPTAIAVTLGKQAWTQNLIPAQTRLTIGGLFWTQQAIALDLANGTLRATQCGKQRF